jgi:hypothetical protein
MAPVLVPLRPLGEGLLIPQLPQKEQADCSSLRASSDYRFIVGALRARRTVCLLLRIILRPRVARAQKIIRLHPLFILATVAGESILGSREESGCYL